MLFPASIGPSRPYDRTLIQVFDAAKKYSVVSHPSLYPDRQIVHEKWEVPISECGQWPPNYMPELIHRSV